MDSGTRPFQDPVQFCVHGDKIAEFPKISTVQHRQVRQRRVGADVSVAAQPSVEGDRLNSTHGQGIDQERGPVKEVWA